MGEDAPSHYGGGTREAEFYEEAERILDHLRENGPATRRELQLVAHLSSMATVNRLNYLREEGEIYRTRDPDDSRKYLYHARDD